MSSSFVFQVKMIYDKETNKPKGYAFIEYAHTRDMKGLLAIPLLFLSDGFCSVFLQVLLMLCLMASCSCI